MPYKSLYVVSCLLHKRALSAVSAKRLRLGVEGPGNIGQLQAVQRWQASGTPYFITSNGVVVEDEKEIANLTKKAEQQDTEDTNITDKEQETVEPPTPSINEDTTVAVEQTAEEESAPNFELDTLLAEVRHLCPNTEHFDNVFDSVEAVFEYTRNLQNQLGNWTLTNLQEKVETLKADVSNAKANENDARQELQAANNKLSELGKDPVSATAHAVITQANVDLVAKVAELQQQLATRPASKQNQLVAESEATIKRLQKSGTITVS